VSGTNFASSQENINAVVVMSDTARVMKPTDRRNGTTMFFQWFKGTGEFVVWAGFGDLVIE
jgi:hypothetical protein